VGGKVYTDLHVHQAAWGTEVLLARLFYYGRTNYSDVFDKGLKPSGWWGMELAWFEDFRMAGNVTENSMNFTLSSIMQYHFQEAAEPGGDGQWNTIDDQPLWTWAPILTDYIYSGGGHKYSELDPYFGLTYLHTTPGSPQYGKEYKYDYVPRVWRLTARQTMTFYLPKPPILVAFHDPYNSTKAPDPYGIKQWNVSMAWAYSVPSSPTVGTWSWDADTYTLTVVGPINFPDPPVTGGKYPLESRPIFVWKRA